MQFQFPFIRYLVAMLLLPIIGLAQAPTFTSFGSSTTTGNSSLVINGTNFTGTTSVRFAEIPAKFTINSSTRITVTVPSVAKTSSLRITNTSGSVLSTAIPVTRPSRSEVFSSVTNTFDGIDIGHYSKPTFTDLDGDGLLDMLIGESDGNLNHYEQNAANSISFTLRTANFNGINVGAFSSAPAFTDLDGDGLLDMILGELDGNLNHYEQNVSNSTSFTLITTNFNSINVGGFGAPAFSDFDGDGLLDMLVGKSAGNLSYYEQNAANSNSFTLRTGNFNGIDEIRFGINVGTKSVPTFIDIDSDGLVNLLIGNADGELYIYEQNSASLNSFNLNTPNFSGIDVGDNSAPTFTDLDSDGLLDLIVGEDAGNLNHYEQNQSPIISTLSVSNVCQNVAVSITGTFFTGATSVKINGTSVGTLSGVTATNITFTVPANATSGDVVVSTPGGTSNSVALTVSPLPTFTSFSSSFTSINSSLVINGTNFTGITSVKFGEIPAKFTVNSSSQITCTVPRVANSGKVSLTNSCAIQSLSTAIPVNRQSSSTLYGSVTESFNSIDVGLLSTPSITDFDGDGLLDMLLGESDGNLNHYEQSAANSTSFTLINSNFNGIDVGAESSPSFTDLDGDGLLDMIIGEQDGNLNHYEQSAANSTSFTLISANFNSIDIGTSSAPTFTDLDGDGLLDMVIGESAGNLNHYEQNTANSTSFTLINANFNAINVGTLSSATFTDLEGNALLDMLVGNNNGVLTRYEQNAANSSTFTLISSNFNSIDIGSHSTPTFTDLDNDGLLDMIIGETEGNLNYYEQNQQPIISSINVNNACQSGPVSITGIGLNGATSVTINGTSVGILSGVTTTNINFIIPANATSGNVVVTTPNGSSNAVAITVNPLPTFTSFGSSSTSINSSLVINGTNLTGITSVKFGETPALFTINSSTQITTTVPRVANTGKVRLSNSGGCNALSTSIPVTRQLSSNVFSEVTTAFNSINVGLSSSPTFTDLDGDGLLDMLVGTNDGYLNHYEQNAANSSSFTRRTSTFNFIDVGNASKPTFTDLDGDGLLDMLIGESFGTLRHYEQVAANSTSFTLRTTSFNGINVGFSNAPTFTDLDGDGLLDFFIGESDGTLNHYEQNAANSTSFTLINTNFNGINVGFSSSPTFTDLDGDGLLDIIIGESAGNLNHYEQNAVNSTSFTLIIENFNGISVGVGSSPTFTDIDGDGLLDMIVGEIDGNLNHYEQTQPPFISTLSANLACQGSTVSITGTGFTGATSVTINGNSVGTLSGVTATNITFTVPLTTTSGNVVVTMPGVTSNAVAITITPTPNTPIITGTNTFCIGGSTVLNSSSATGNLWSNGATTQSISVGTAGNYSVRVISGGCTSLVSNEVTVSVNPIPSAPTISLSNGTSICTNETTTLSAGIASSFVWSNGGTTSTITVGAGTYSLRTLNAEGCTSAVSGEVVITQQVCNQIFSGIGNLNSNNNWSTSVMPNTNTDVIIDGVLTVGSNYSLRNISINPADTIKIPTGVTLTITGNLANEGVITGLGTLLMAGANNQSVGGGSISNLTVANGETVFLSAPTSIAETLTLGDNTTFDLNNNPLMLLSNATQTARLAAVPSGASLTSAGNFTVQRWLNPNNVRAATNARGNYYFTGPVVQNQTVALWNGVSPYGSETFNQANQSGSRFYFHNATLNAWRKPTSLSQSLPAGTGVQVWFGTQAFFLGGRTTWSASGIPVIGNFNMPLTSGVTGFNLLSNPYPSTIDWDSPNWTKTGIANSIYIYDWVNQRYRTYINGIGINGGIRYLPTAQGFFVNATTANPILTATENIKVSNQAAIQRTQSNVNGLIRLQLTNGTVTDEMVIANRQQATTSFETDQDAQKMMNPTTNIFVSGAVNQSIASMNLNGVNSIPFTIQSSTTGMVTLTTTELSGLEGYTFNLFDEQTGELLPYIGSETYTFNVTANQAYRLQLRVGSVTGIETFKATVFEVFPNPASVKVTIRTNGIGTIEIVNNLGQVLITQPAIGTNEINISKLAMGVYSVKFNGVSQKLVVK